MKEGKKSAPLRKLPRSGHIRQRALAVPGSSPHGRARSQNDRCSVASLPVANSIPQCRPAWGAGRRLPRLLETEEAGRSPESQRAWHDRTHERGGCIARLAARSRLPATRAAAMPRSAEVPWFDPIPLTISRNNLTCSCYAAAKPTHANTLDPVLPKAAASVPQCLPAHADCRHVYPPSST